VSLHNAIVDSCDVFFYNVGKQLGIDKIAYYGSGLGLGKRTGIDLPSEEPGLMPSEPWVERVFHHKWYAGETISVAIGQGAVTVTPIQLARMAAAVASGGTLVRPHLLKNDPNMKTENFPLSDNTVEQVTQGLYGVVNEGGGTAYHLRLQNIDLCGKSGTAQLMSYDAANRMGTKKMDGWFVGFAPRRNPEIVVAAIVQDTVEHGGEAAGPVVRDIVKTYYDKKNARMQQTATNDAPAQPPITKPLVATVGVQHP
jgi:penicillin-binding protein 2